MRAEEDGGSGIGGGVGDPKLSVVAVEIDGLMEDDVGAVAQIDGDVKRAGGGHGGNGLADDVEVGEGWPGGGRFGGEAAGGGIGCGVGGWRKGEGLGVVEMFPEARGGEDQCDKDDGGERDGEMFGAGGHGGSVNDLAR